MSSFYILHVKSSDTWFANIFPHYTCCFFIFLTISFTIQKSFSLYNPTCLLLLFLFELLVSRKA